MKVCIIGLGYVGLPLACLCAKKGHQVIGIDKDAEKVDKINSKVNPIKDEYVSANIITSKIFATTDETKLKEADIVLVCVPTPVDKNYNPDLSFVEDASEMIRRNLKAGQIIVLESTVSPGTVKNVMKPILEKSGLKAGKDFALGHCPERIDPGNAKWTVENIPRIVGGLTDCCLEKIYDFYSSIMDVDIVKVSSVDAAEAVKIVENAFRDVNIAFVNELARSFDKIGIDVSEVIKAASTKPYAFMPHHPGCGVGGHCIGVDPYYLIKSAKDIGFDHDFLKLARKINNSMPHYTVEKTVAALNRVGKAVNGTNITILGLSYKKDVDDVREAPSKIIIDELKKLGANIKTYDPYVHSSLEKNLDSALKNSECVVICTDHTEFRNIDLNKIKDSGVKVIIDGRNIINKEDAVKLGLIYSGIGR